MTDLQSAAKDVSLEDARHLFNVGVNAKEDTSTPLHYSSKEGDVDLLIALIAAGADVNSRNEKGITPLHLSNNIEVVKKLIAAGADVNIKNEEGKTPLHYSVDVDVVKTLIAAGADVNAKDKVKRTPLHYMSNIEVVEALLAAGADVHVKDVHGSTPLHHISNVEVAKALIAAGADVNAREIGGRTPLHRNDNGEAVKTLIAAGADVNAKDEELTTPLHLCSDIEAIKALIAAGADVNACDKSGITPLLYSALFGLCDSTRTLLAAGADTDIKGGFRSSPMEIANFFCQKDTCKILIKHTMLYKYMPPKPQFKLSEINEYWDICVEEVKKLRETFLGNSCISFYSFLTETDENKIALFSSEENFGINNKFERTSYYKEFSMFSEDIETQFIKGSKRAHLLHQTQKLMKNYFFETLPMEIIIKICYHLKNDDLKTYLTSHNIN